MINLTQIQMYFVNIFFQEFDYPLLLFFQKGNIHFQFLHQAVIRTHRSTQLIQNQTGLPGQFQHGLQGFPVKLVLKLFPPRDLVQKPGKLFPALPAQTRALAVISYQHSLHDTQLLPCHL